MTFLRPPLVSLAAAAAAAGLLAAPLTASPPEIETKQAEAATVLAQVNRLDVEVGKIVDDWNGARVALGRTESRLRANRTELRRAQRLERLAQARVADRVVSLYEQDQPNFLDIVIDSAQMSDVIDAVDTAQRIAAADARIAVDARQARERLARTQAELRSDEEQRRQTLEELTNAKARITGLLVSRRSMLVSIQSQLAELQARERRRQAVLAAQARARLQRREAAAREAAAREAARQAAAEAARHVPATTASTSASTSTLAAPTTAATATTEAQTEPATTSAPTPSVTTAAGHPDAASVALRYLGVPYRWGGSTPSGFDCSGLVTYVYAQLGVQLPHFAAGQYGYGTPVSRDQLQPGDLVFFDGLSHVGIYVGGGQFVHAPQTGDVVKISSVGDLSFVGARRV